MNETEVRQVILSGFEANGGLLVLGAPGHVALFPPLPDQSKTQINISVCPVVIGPSDVPNSPLPVIVAAEVNAGRVVVLGHEGYVNHGDLKTSGPIPRSVAEATAQTGDDGQEHVARLLMRNVCSWLLREQDAKQHGSVPFALPNANSKIWVNQMPPRVAPNELFVWTNFDAPGVHPQAVCQYIESGGRAIVASCPWGWKCQHAGKAIHEHPANVALQSFGIFMLESIAHGNCNGNRFYLLPRFDDSATYCAAHAAADTSSAKGAGATRAEQPVTRDVRHVIGASQPLESGPRVAYQDGGGWWCHGSDHLWICFEFPRECTLSRCEVFCANSDGCPKVVRFTAAATKEELNCQSASFASSSLQQRQQQREFPYPRGQSGVGHTPQTFRFNEGSNSTSSGCCITCKYLRVDFEGIHNSHYIGVNDIRFWEMAPLGTRRLVTLSKVANVGDARLRDHLDQHVALSVFERHPDIARLVPSTNQPVSVDEALRDAVSGMVARGDLAVQGLDDFPGAPKTDRAGGFHPSAASAGVICINVSDEEGAYASDVSEAILSSGGSNNQHHHEATWVSTSAYALPRGRIRIVVKPLAQSHGWQAAVTKQWSVQVGCHTDDTTPMGSWRRWPRLTQRLRFASSSSNELTIEARCPFGGCLYMVREFPKPISPSSAATSFSLSVRIEGDFCLAPYYRLHLASNSNNASLLHRPGTAPWTELEGRYCIMTLPSETVAKHSAQQIQDAVEFWDSAIASHHELCAPPYGRRKERIVVDRQLACGYMHSGYPIMAHLDFADRALDAATLRREGEWGMLHELGHNMQRQHWTWGATSEVSTNWFTLYTMDRVVGKKHNEFPYWIDVRNRDTFFASAPNRRQRYAERWSKDPALGLRTFAELLEKFGWDLFRTSLQQHFPYHSEAPQDEQRRIDTWVRVTCRVSGHNLVPFYRDRWCWPISDNVEREMLSMPVFVYEQSC